jgi:hypothetical protein
VEVAVGFRGETGVDFLKPAAFQVFVNNIGNKIIGNAACFFSHDLSPVGIISLSL